MQHFFALQPKLYPVSHVRVSDHLTFYRTGGQAADNLVLKGHHQQKQGVIEKAVQLRRDHAGLHYRHNITLRLIMRATIDTRGYLEFVAILTLKSLDDLSRNRCSAGGEDMHVLCRGREC